MSNGAIIVAAGKSERFGDKLPKQFHQIAERPLLAWTIDAFEKARTIDNIVLVTSSEYLSFVTQNVIDPYKYMKVNKVIEGGATRRESVLFGLKALPNSTNVVAIHDGVRPLVTPDDIDKVIESARSNRAAILAVPSRDTIKEVDNNTVSKTIDRSKIWLAQTPQAFDYKLIMKANSNSSKSEGITDDSLLVEKLGVKVTVIEPSASNIKVTTQDDLHYVDSVLRKRTNV